MAENKCVTGAMYNLYKWSDGPPTYNWFQSQGELSLQVRDGEQWKHSKPPKADRSNQLETLNNHA